MKTKIENPCCEEAETIENLDKLTLSNAAEDILNAMIFDECENMRHKLTRKLFRIRPKYEKVDVIRCAGTKFRTNVYNRTIHLMALMHLSGKRYFNVRRLIKRAIVEEILLTFGK